MCVTKLNTILNLGFKANNTHLYIITELTAAQHYCNHTTQSRNDIWMWLTNLQPRMNFSQCNHLWLCDLNSIQAESTTETCAELGHDDTHRLRRLFFPPNSQSQMLSTSPSD